MNPLRYDGPLSIDGSAMLHVIEHDEHGGTCWN